ncbi:tagaturonate reductase [Sanguibacter sp. A247]|uniref:tagaturonate reductase n=1 Tax=unclassified Sanguibacter TaxID=2645534 RepID=UPI003FD882B0
MTTVSLPRLSASAVGRTSRPVTVLQFGGGNFLRAFVDQMIHAANEAGVMNAGVAVVHATPGPDRALELLEEQDGLYHVLLEGVRAGEPVREFTRIDVIERIVRAHEQFAEYRELYLSRDLKVIVSNTTEAGIAWVEDDDLAAQPPASFPAKVAALLHDRYLTFEGAPDAGVRIVCCELIEDNATTLREYVLRHARAAEWGAEFEQWVLTANSFHDTLVDRIVPGFPRDEIGEIQAELGFADDVVVKGEYFGVWAIGGDPVVREVLPLDRAGQPVKFMDDIRPFRAKKVKILNGLHTAMAAVGLQLGCETVREAFERPDVRAYLDALLEDEILPSIAEPREELRTFAATIVERFGNPYLHHRLADIALNSVSKWGARNLPVLLSAFKDGRDAPRTGFAAAALLTLYVRGPEGFEPRDDADVIAAVRDAFDPADVPAWVRTSVAAAGYVMDCDGCRDRLVDEVAAHAARILDVGVGTSLGELPAR